VAIFIYAYLGFWAVVLLYPRVHAAAAVLLIGGLALQTSRVSMIHACGFHTLVRRSIGWMMALLVGAATMVFGWQALTEHRALPESPPASPDAPNVLLIVLDTVRAQSLSTYGYGRPTTPQLSRIAKGGVRFERALSTAPWTLPSHASMFTGRFPHELSAGWYAPLDASYPTLAEVLSAHGYVTAGFVGNAIYCSYETGLARGFAHYEDYLISPGEIIRSASLLTFITDSHLLRRMVGFYNRLGRKTAAEVNRDFLRWLDRGKFQIPSTKFQTNSNDQKNKFQTVGAWDLVLGISQRSRVRRPFFVFLNYFDAHDPYLPPSPFDQNGGPKTPRDYFLIRHWWVLEKDKLPPEEVRVAQDAYEGAIAYLDHQLGLLFDALEQRGVLQNTLVIITSDHGEHFGERQLFCHGNSLYRPLLHVPLLIRFPSRAPAGQSVAEPVSLRDLPATVMDLLQIEDGVPFPGRSLARYWKDPREGVRGKGSEGRGQDRLIEPAQPVAPLAPLASFALSEIAAPSRFPPDHGRSPVISGPKKSLVAAGWHYIRNDGDGREELYDLENDPLETQDLAAAASRQTLDRFRTTLAKMLEDSGATNEPRVVTSQGKR
jgi:arylsulfatase A-like enzyme